MNTETKGKLSQKSRRWKLIDTWQAEKGDKERLRQKSGIGCPGLSVACFGSTSPNKFRYSSLLVVDLLIAKYHLELRTTLKSTIFESNVEVLGTFLFLLPGPQAKARGDRRV